MTENLTTRIANARNRMAEALMAAHSTSEHLADTKEALASIVGQARLNGQIEGKNEADREASARLLFSEQYQAVGFAEVDASHAKLELELARNELGWVNDDLRNAEIAAGINLSRAA